MNVPIFVLDENLDILAYDASLANNLDYLEIPIMAKLKMGKQWSLYGGGYAGLAISKKVKVTILGQSAEFPIEDSLMNDLDYGLLFGAEVSITDKILIDARYNMGLTDVFKSGNSKISTLSIAATYLL